jgi:predicted lactoylglutathione lyase
MLDHVGVEVRNLETSKEFYLQALKPLGYELFLEHEKWVGFAVNGKPDFWLKESHNEISSVHIAFCAQNRQIVNQFYEAALMAGGKDNGKPGLREHYHPNYYGAFVFDPNGHNIEAVCHEPENPAV